MNHAHKIKFFLLTALCLWDISTACCASTLHDPALDHILEKVKTVYGITLHYAEGPAEKIPHVRYSLVDANDRIAFKKSLVLFIKEIRLYPKNFFRNADCRDIYFVKKFFYKEKPVDGIFTGLKNYIFYDYSRNSNNPRKIRHDIHHELYHMIGSRHPFWNKHSPAWESLNRPGFTYDPKYNPHERNPINFFAPAEPGFITDYAMSSAEEDRAEMFACMMLPEELRLMEQWAQKDKILFNKVEMMKKFLKEDF